MRALKLFAALILVVLLGRPAAAQTGATILDLTNALSGSVSLTNDYLPIETTGSSRKLAMLQLRNVLNVSPTSVLTLSNHTGTTGAFTNLSGTTAILTNATVGTFTLGSNLIGSIVSTLTGPPGVLSGTSGAVTLTISPSFTAVTATTGTFLNLTGTNATVQTLTLGGNLIVSVITSLTGPAGVFSGTSGAITLTSTPTFTSIFATNATLTTLTFNGSSIGSLVTSLTQGAGLTLFSGTSGLVTFTSTPTWLGGTFNGNLSVTGTTTLTGAVGINTASTSTARLTIATTATNDTGITLIGTGTQSSPLLEGRTQSGTSLFSFGQSGTNSATITLRPVIGGTLEIGTASVQSHLFSGVNGVTAVNVGGLANGKFQHFGSGGATVIYSNATNNCVGIGTASPSQTSWLNVAAGTATKSQIVFDTSTLTTVPTAGSLGYDGTNLSLANVAGTWSPLVTMTTLTGGGFSPTLSSLVVNGVTTLSGAITGNGSLAINGPFTVTTGSGNFLGGLFTGASFNVQSGILKVSNRLGIAFGNANNGDDVSVDYVASKTIKFGQGISGGFSQIAGLRLTTQALTTNGNITGTQNIITLSGNSTATLQSAVGLTGSMVFVVNTDNTTSTVTCTGGQLINGASTLGITQTGRAGFFSDGTNYRILYSQ